MNYYDQGDQVRVSGSFTDADGAYADPTAIKFDITDPNNSTTTYIYGTDTEVARADTGRYTCDFDVDTVGLWHWVVYSTGTGKAADEGYFYVERHNFSYSDALSTDRDKVRFHLRDTAYNSGPLPGDDNFTDNELDGLISAEGTWERAVAAGLEALAMAWARYPSFKADGFSINRSDVAKAYREEAAKWRQNYGRTKGVNVAGIIRIDGYSDDVASDDVDTGSEYEADFEYVTPEL